MLFSGPLLDSCQDALERRVGGAGREYCRVPPDVYRLAPMLDAHGQLLVVCHTWREAGEGAFYCCIISARKATKTEARQHRAR